MNDEMPTGLKAIAATCAVVLTLAGQVVALGGVWAAFTGNDFLFWSYAEEGANLAHAALILFIGEPLIMFVAYLAFMAVGLLLSVPLALIRRR